MKIEITNWRNDKTVFSLPALRQARQILASVRSERESNSTFRTRVSETTDKSGFSWPQRFIRDGVIARQVWPSDKEDFR